MGIDKARHQHPPRQIDHLGLLADIRINPRIAAHINNLSTGNGERLVYRVLTIDGVHLPVAHHHVRRS